MTKKIFRVYTHPTQPIDNPYPSPLYYVAESKEQLEDEWYDEHYSAPMMLDSIEEVTPEEVVNLLNLYIE
jgi:hypothetical protein